MIITGRAASGQRIPPPPRDLAFSLQSKIDCSSLRLNKIAFRLSVMAVEGHLVFVIAALCGHSQHWLEPVKLAGVLKGLGLAAVLGQYEHGLNLPLESTPKLSYTPARSSSIFFSWLPTVSPSSHTGPQQASEWWRQQLIFQPYEATWG